ncbi:MAG: copper-binding protein [Rickettsiales bacterium]|nr:copper-binding protein [Rickettsiales bacterium]|tara:strand:+ start:1750 stop:2166 length:417 start_codon:yes stop_codon:yes gene_type:complete
MFRYAALLLCFIFVSNINAKGDLSIRSKKLELKLGSDKSDYDMSQKTFNMETGKAYRLEISSMGFKEYEIEAEDFFRNIWVRSIEIDGVELDAPIINEIEFEREGEIEIKFVPIRPGNYDFEIEGLQSKGMVGQFIVK